MIDFKGLYHIINFPSWVFIFSTFPSTGWLTTYLIGVSLTRAVDVIVGSEKEVSCLRIILNVCSVGAFVTILIANWLISRRLLVGGAFNRIYTIILSACIFSQVIVVGIFIHQKRRALAFLEQYVSELFPL